MKKIILNNGIEIDSIALGTFRAKETEAYNAVKNALNSGYRHIDTAAIYGNEKEVGQAIKDSGIPREELFITTKLWNSDQGYDNTFKAFKKSLQNLQIDYIDLYLIHWPKGYDLARQSWQAMEELYESGKIRAIGVSNFQIHHINNLLEEAKIIPAVNQVECHVGLQNHVLKEYCDSKDIILEAYAPLMSNKIGDLLENKVLIEIAEKHNATVPQVAIAWLLKRGIVALPKSITPSRIVSNLIAKDISLDQEDMNAIRKLNNGIRTFPDSDNIDF